jgi:hypothetical protein
MKRVILAIAGASLLATTPAVGGEIGGNGNYVPGGDKGASICSYSGLNDTPDDGFGFTQTFAAVFKFLGLIPRLFNPGDTCRGN